MEGDPDTRQEGRRQEGNVSAVTIFRNIYFLLAAVAIAKAAIADELAGRHGTGRVAAPGSFTSAATANNLSRKANDERKTKPFFLPGLDGESHSLADWKGKVVMLNFWATWCSPCLFEIRDLVAFQKQYKARGLQIIGLGFDEERKLRNVQRSLEINYPVLIADPVGNDGLMKQWGNSSGAVPYTVVIDRDGRMAYVHHGLLSRDVFDENVLPLLDKANTGQAGAKR